MTLVKYHTLSYLPRGYSSLEVLTLLISINVATPKEKKRLTHHTEQQLTGLLVAPRPSTRPFFSFFPFRSLISPSGPRRTGVESARAEEGMVNWRTVGTRTHALTHSESHALDEVIQTPSHHNHLKPSAQLSSHPFIFPRLVLTFFSSSII